MRGRRAERGQTILLVAVSIVALLSMAALAIDVVTLYVDKSEIQRAADAAALVGAKAVADSGVTTLASTDTEIGAAEGLATTMATSAVTAMLSASAANANLVGGQAPQLVTGYPIIDFTTHGNNNPTVTVKLQQLNLPTFFARIFAQTSAMTGATATAEAYNPANMAEPTPILTQCVKPWLMANGDPTQGGANGVTLNPIINQATGALEPSVANFIGASFFLASDCNSSGGGGCLLSHPSINIQAGGYPGARPPYAYGTYYIPALTGPTNNVYPASASSLNPYAQSVAGCDYTVYSCGGSTTNATWDPTVNPNQGTSTSDELSFTAQGVESLLGFTPPGEWGPGLGQDTISYPLGWPTSPPTITVNSGGQKTSLVSTSNSIVTIPIIAETSPSPTVHPVTVIGFLQAFINYVGYKNSVPPPPPPQNDYGAVNVTVMNVVGCSQNLIGNPVSGDNATCGVSGGTCPGGGNSPIPVRLITPP